MLLPVLLALTGPGCAERVRAGRTENVGLFRTALPDERPQMLNDDEPFRYPLSLYRQRIEGNVLLRLFVAADGRVVPESTRLVDASGYRPLDSAALAGAVRLRFRAARLRGQPVAVSLLFPVHFRHPEGPLVPGDSL